MEALEEGAHDPASSSPVSRSHGRRVRPGGCSSPADSQSLPAGSHPGLDRALLGRRGASAARTDTQRETKHGRHQQPCRGCFADPGLIASLLAASPFRSCDDGVGLSRVTNVISSSSRRRCRGLLWPRSRSARSCHAGACLARGLVGLRLVSHCLGRLQHGEGARRRTCCRRRAGDRALNRTMSCW